MITGFEGISPEIFDAIGICGFFLYVTNYSLLTFGKLDSAHSAYFAINFFAASCVLIGMSQSFNLASALVQIFWIVVSTVAIVIRVKSPRKRFIQLD